MCSRICIPALGHYSGEEKWAAEPSDGKNMGADESNDHQLHRRQVCPYRSGRRVIHRVRSDHTVAKITIHCKGDDPSWGMPEVTAGRWMVLEKSYSLRVKQQRYVGCHNEDSTNNPVPTSFLKDPIIIDNLGGRNIFPTAWKHNKCQGLLSWQSTQQSPAAEENPRH